MVGFISADEQSQITQSASMSCKLHSGTNIMFAMCVALVISVVFVISGLVGQDFFMRCSFRGSFFQSQQ